MEWREVYYRMRNILCITSTSNFFFDRSPFHVKAENVNCNRYLVPNCYCNKAIFGVLWLKSGSPPQTGSWGCGKAKLQRAMSCFPAESPKLGFQIGCCLILYYCSKKLQVDIILWFTVKEIILQCCSSTLLDKNAGNYSFPPLYILLKKLRSNRLPFYFIIHSLILLQLTSAVDPSQVLEIQLRVGFTRAYIIYIKYEHQWRYCYPPVLNDR
jgi:hypothetical protein